MQDKIVVNDFGAPDEVDMTSLLLMKGSHLYNI
jgi:hypothetical protein